VIYNRDSLDLLSRISLSAKRILHSEDRASRHARRALARSVCESRD